MNKLTSMNSKKAIHLLFSKSGTINSLLCSSSRKTDIKTPNPILFKLRNSSTKKIMHLGSNVQKSLRPVAHYLLIIIILEILSPTAVNGLSIQDVSIYPGRSKSKTKVSFSALGDFSNLQELLKMEGFLDVGLFCVKRGAFLLYRNPFYEVDDPSDDIRIVSGNHNCFRPTFTIGSSQPLGPVNLPKLDSITFFHRPYFSSIGKATSFPVGFNFFVPIGHSIKSLVMIGRTRWTIKTAAGKKYCLTPKGLKDEISPICLVPDFTKTLIKQQGILIVSVKRGCKEDVTNKIAVTFCHYWGKAGPINDDGQKIDDVHEIGELKKGLAGRSIFDTGCGEGEKNPDFNETLRLFKAVLINSFDQGVILDWPGFGKEKWKLELFDFIFEIAKESFADDFISDSYLNRIRELFLYTLEKVWSTSGNSTDGGSGGDDDVAAGDSRLNMLSEYDYRGVLVQTEECLTNLGSDVAILSSLAWNSITSPDDVASAIDEELKRKKDANIVIEMTWLITNMVGGLCHSHFGFSQNYWVMYVHIVNKLFLTPVMPLWYTKIPNLDVILGGNMEVQYAKLAISASVALKDSNSVEPFQRPETEETKSDTKKSR